jgi:hypothetical protein
MVSEEGNIVIFTLKGKVAGQQENKSMCKNKA